MTDTTREEFVQKYMATSGITDYRVEGERVYFGGDYYKCVLPCYCRATVCHGWAMVAPDLRDWHMSTDGKPQ